MKILSTLSYASLGFIAGIAYVIACGASDGGGSQRRQNPGLPAAMAQASNGKTGARAVLLLRRDIDYERCDFTLNDSIHRSLCCPSGFTQVGVSTRGGSRHAVCLENQRSGRAILELDYNTHNEPCSTNLDESDGRERCCPDDFTFVGLTEKGADEDNGPEDHVVCLENI